MAYYAYIVSCKRTGTTYKRRLQNFLPAKLAIKFNYFVLPICTKHLVLEYLSNIFCHHRLVPKDNITFVMKPLIQDTVYEDFSNFVHMYYDVKRPIYHVIKDGSKSETGQKKAKSCSQEEWCEGGEGLSRHRGYIKGPLVER